MNKTYRFKRIGLLAIGIIILQFAYSQENYKPGYVINNDSDTIVGLVDYKEWRRNPEVIKFKTHIENDPIFYRPVDITEFRVDDEIYMSGTIETEISPIQMDDLDYDPQIKIKVETAFIQALFRGEKSLYHFISTTGIENYYIKQDTGFDLLVYKRYLKQQDGKTIMLENKKYVGQLIVYLNDCPTVSSKLEKTLYNKASLLKAFQYYYECVSSDIDFQKEIKKLNFEIGTLAGVSVTSLDFSSRDFPHLVNADYNSSVNFTVGLFIDLILPVSKGRWSINNEILFSSYKVKGSYTDLMRENKYTITSTEIGQSYLKINNLIRYKHPVGDWFLFLNGGMSNGLSISETNYKKTKSLFHTTENFFEGLALDETRKYEFGLLAGIGAKYSRFSIELRYEMGNGMSKYIALKSSAKRYFLLIGYRF